MATSPCVKCQRSLVVLGAPNAILLSWFNIVKSGDETSNYIERNNMTPYDCDCLDQGYFIGTCRSGLSSPICLNPMYLTSCRVCHCIVITYKNLQVTSTACVYGDKNDPEGLVDRVDTGTSTSPRLETTW